MNVWARNSIQFARLLSEIKSIGLTAEQYDKLIKAMGIERKYIDELICRANDEWESIGKAYNKASVNINPTLPLPPPEKKEKRKSYIKRGYNPNQLDNPLLECDSLL